VKEKDDAPKPAKDAPAPAAEPTTPAEQPAAVAATAEASKALDGHYKVVGIQPGRVATLTHRTVDLRTIDLATAHELFKSGKFPYLEKVSQANE
jgi:hypothetical protein